MASVSAVEVGRSALGRRSRLRAWRGELQGSEYTWAIAFCIPYIALFLAFVVYPIGFGIWMGNFRDVLLDREANKLMSDWLAGKIRARVKDPAVAEKLVPKTHGFGTRRVPLESGYFEVYNQPNVELVDINETPIERITPAGIRTSAKEYDFDLIVYATGFDANHRQFRSYRYPGR